MFHRVAFCVSILLTIASMYAFSQIPTPAHVVIVVEENHDYAQIIGVNAAPYINGLSLDSNGALFTESFALTHPSQPNYLMLFSGSNQGVKNDSVPKGIPFTTDNLGASVIKAGKTFAGYSEDLPQAGFEGEKSGQFARKHSPWINWQSSPTCGIPASSNLPFTDFPKHFDTLPTVAFVSPNLNDDMHNGTNPGTITTADTWLKDHIDGYLQWAKKNNSLLILTFDEGKDSGTNRIATIFVGPMVKHGQYNEKIDHYSLLRTVEDMFGLTHAGSSATATPITDCWKGKTEILKIAFRPQDSYAPGLSILNLVLTPRDRRFGINGFSYAGPVVFNLLGRTTISAYRDDAPGNTQLHAFPGGLSSGIYLMKSR